MQEHDHHHEVHNGNVAVLAELEENTFKLAISTTLHCLLGCGIGEVVGMILATWWAWGNVASITLAVILGFVFGFILGLWPLLRADMPFSKAFKIILAAEGISIAVMETAEVLVEIYTPGVMGAGLTDSIFWFGMLFALAAGFLAAFPVNVILIKRGVRHQH